MYSTTIDISQIRADFPILQRQVNGQPLVYLDNAATSQTPLAVIDAISDYYKHTNANIHRGVHALSQEATDQFEAARQKIQTHFNAAQAHEIIFTSGTTHSINLVANGFASFLEKGDELIVSTLEHHANIVPWQMLCERTGAQLKVIPINENGTLDMSVYADLLGDRTKVVFVNHVSNALGIINPIEEIIEEAHAFGAAVLIDGAQATPHLIPDVQALDVEFYTTSAHKICGPTGMGALYGKEAWLRKLPPYQGGGEMIDQVTFDKTTYADLPHKFEAGTPNIAGGVGFGAAVDYMNNIGFDAIAAHENDLMRHATEKLRKIEGLHIYGDVDNKVAVISFNVEGLHPYDIGTLLDKMGIAVRTGHHCCQPIMDHFQIPGTVRASFAFYNTHEEVERFIAGVEKAVGMLR
ncbi:MAG: cysteine desulfurase CsdA [Flavobacteriaceae bacterium]|nr:cysteine desulfurase CsdA [Flavobacteriaceae bacterium]